MHGTRGRRIYSLPQRTHATHPRTNARLARVMASQVAEPPHLPGAAGAATPDGAPGPVNCPRAERLGPVAGEGGLDVVWPAS